MHPERRGRRRAPGDAAPLYHLGVDLSVISARDARPTRDPVAGPDARFP
jgi:hypothetical protein